MSAPMNDEPRPSLGILQCGHAPAELLGERYPNYPDLFVSLLGREAFDYRTWAVVDGEFPPDASAADAWLITGSRHGVYEAHDWIAPLETLVREIQGSGRPLVGICFGHQIIAQALGGRVEKHAGGWSIGRVEYRLDASLDTARPEPRRNAEAEPGNGAGDASSEGDSAGTSRTVPLMAYHQDQVVEPPPGALKLGESDVCRYAAFAIGDSIRTLQPHPEFDVRFVSGLLDTRGASLPPASLVRGRDSLADAADVEPARAGVAAELRAFLLGGVRARAAARDATPAEAGATGMTAGS